VALSSTTISTSMATRRGLSRRQRKELAFYLFIAPWLLGFLFLTLTPLVLGFAISLTNYDGLNLETVKFLGFRNYERAFADEEVSYALTRTAIFTLSAVPVGLVVSMALAVILNLDVKLRGVFRTILYIPHIIPVVAATWAWKLMLDVNVGLVNAGLSVFQPGLAVNWLAEFATPTLVAYTTWAAAGGGMIIFLAGLQGIPSELREAAQIDGATPWRSFRSIVLPLLTPVIFFQLIMGLIGALQTFVQAVLLAPAGSGVSGFMQILPARPNMFLMAYDYVQIFSNQRFGYGTALLWILFALVLVVTLIVFVSERFWVHYEVGGEKR
jgi:multiple sugar transport system permease protein